MALVCATGCTKKEEPESHECVDLGLPSGILWATCNIGATAPEGYGDSFAWGETTTKTTCNWSTYKYCKGGSSRMTKYCTETELGYVYGNNGFTDNLTILQPEDDVATVNWGSDWRMPTWEDWEELYENTTNTWTTQNNVKGRLFVGPNGKSIFLPAAGLQENDKFYNVSSSGYYWLSSLYTDMPNCAWCFAFSSGPFCGGDWYSRYFGLSVRPVRSAGKN